MRWSFVSPEKCEVDAINYEEKGFVPELNDVVLEELESEIQKYGSISVPGILSWLKLGYRNTERLALPFSGLLIEPVSQSSKAYYFVLLFLHAGTELSMMRLFGKQRLKWRQLLKLKV